MLHVLTAQIVAEERERAIQRRLREAAVRREAATTGRVEAPPAPRHDASLHAAGRRCGACPPAAAGAC